MLYVLIVAVAALVAAVVIDGVLDYRNRKHAEKLWEDYR